MVKKNLLGIVIVILIAAAFVGGYVVGRGSAPQMSQAQRMAMAPGQQPPGGGQRPPGANGPQPASAQPAGNPAQQSSGQPPTGQQPESAQPGPANGGDGTQPQQRPSASDNGSPGGGQFGGDMTDEMRAAVTKAREEGKSREEIQTLIAKLREDAAGQPSPAEQPPAVAPTPEKPANALEFYGTAAPSAEVNVQSKQGGTLIVLNGKEGDSVKKGALLAQFDDSEQQLNLDKARSSRNNAQQQVQQAESNVKSAQTTLERNQQLFKDGLLSQQQLDDLESKVETARSSLSNAQENVKQADTQITLLENALGNFKVYAPISGVIDKKNYNLQEIYRANDVLFHIVNIDEVYVNVDVPETYIKRIQEGMPVSLTFNALGEQVISGVLETVLPSGTTASRTFTVKVRVKNPGHAIKPGMFAAVEMVLPE